MRLIDADDLKKAFEKVYPLATNEMGGVANKRIYEIINNTPTVTPDKIQVLMKDYLICRCEPEIPKGEWIKWNFKTFGAMGDWEYKCSNCGKVYGGEYNFCPNCGAEMQKGSTE